MKWTTEPPTEPGWYWIKEGALTPYIEWVDLKNLKYYIDGSRFAGPIPEPEGE